MSRAFVKDDDDRPEQPIRRVAADRPNYVTPEGLAALDDALAAARAANDARNVDYYEQRVSTAIVVNPSEDEPGVAGFGSTVTVRDSKGRTTRVRIVGEDEADAAHGKISWTSPYAQALMEKRAGETAIVQLPAGPVAITIVEIE